VGLRHLRLHAQRRRGGRLLGHSGLRFNFEYDYINQDALRSGTGTATPAQVTNNPSNPALVVVKSKSRRSTATSPWA